MERDIPYRRKARTVSRGKWFLFGLFAGLILTVLSAFGLAAYAVKHPDIILDRLAERSVGNVLTTTLQSIPRETIRERQDEIVRVVGALSDAYAEDRLSSEALRDIGSRVFGVAADRKVTSEEIDELLRFLQPYTK